MPQTVDVSGLQANSVKTVETLVELLRKADSLDESKKKPLAPRKLDEFFDSLSKGSRNLPELPVDFSRADIYSDHD